MRGTPQKGGPKFQLFNHSCYIHEIFRICKYQEKIKFDKIWDTKMMESSSNKDALNSKFNHLRWTDEIFRIDKMKLNLTKFEGTKMKGSYSNKDAKIQN